MAYLNLLFVSGSGLIMPSGHFSAIHSAAANSFRGSKNIFSETGDFAKYFHTRRIFLQNNFKQVSF
jgi:hypothetical protein